MSFIDFYIDLITSLTNLFDFAMKPHEKIEFIKYF
jgi:hypothetical protein